MAGLLDTDVTALLPLVRGGLDWWLGQLAELARPLLRERGGRGAHTVAVRQADGRYALLRQGVAVGWADPLRPTRAAVLLEPGRVLVRETAAMGLSRRDWTRLIENDIDRLTPFTPDTVYAATRFADAEDGRQTALLAVTPRVQAQEALRRAVAGGIAPRALLAETPDGEAIDLSPALRAAGLFGRPSGARGWWWTVAALLVLNVAAACWRDGRDTDRLQDEADRQRPVAIRIINLRRRVMDEAARRRELLAARANAAPLRVLGATSRALPDSAWVQRLEYQDSKVRLTGFHVQGVDVLAALQAEPAFGQVRSAAADLGATAVDPALGQPFDLLAEVRRPAAATAR